LQPCGRSSQLSSLVCAMSWEMQVSSGAWVHAPFKPPAVIEAGKKCEFTFEGMQCTLEFTSATEGTVSAAGKTYPARVNAPTGGRKYILGCNWKSNPASIATAKELAAGFKACTFDATKVEVVVCPASIHMAAIAAEFAGSGIEVGVQNISKTKNGAFTGEVTASMAKEMGYTWCIIGHSERRALFGETVEDTVAKLQEAQEAGLKVMFAIGEKLEEREAGTTDEVNKSQLAPVLPLVKDWDAFVIAYEPVWAIGTGKVASPEQAQETQSAIRAFVKETCGEEAAAKVRIQYGGSSSPDNIDGLACNPDIDGFLVGGAALKPTFTKMIDHLNSL